MNSVLITPKSQTELKFISDLLKKMQIESKILTDKQKEDMGMAFLMNQADRNKKVSRATIMKELKLS